MVDPIDTPAGEYVLGTLDPAEHAAFVASLAGSASARRAVADWRERLEPLLTDAPEASPPPGAWQAIEARIAPPAANDDRVSPLWRGAAVAASLLAVLAGGLALRPQAVAPRSTATAGASYVAAVTAKGAEPALLVTIDPRSGRAVVRAIGLTPPARRSLELWCIDETGAPRSLGLVSGDMRAEMPLGPMPAGPGAMTFAVTVEPEGGAPSGVPSGEILYSGKAMAIAGT